MTPAHSWAQGNMSGSKYVYNAIKRDILQSNYEIAEVKFPLFLETFHLTTVRGLYNQNTCNSFLV